VIRRRIVVVTRSLAIPFFWSIKVRVILYFLAQIITCYVSFLSSELVTNSGTIDAIENSRSTLLASAEESLDTIHNDLYTRVEAIKSSHESTKALTISQLKAILAPLEDEKIETNITRNGVPISEVRRVGDSVTELKQVLATKGKEIEEAWIEWRGVQAELMQLGGDVLGGEMFKKGKEKAGAAEGGGRKSGSDGRGFKRTMELWDIELMAKKKEIEEEIQEAGRIMIRKLAASEKVCRFCHSICYCCAESFLWTQY
jgi:hypothetical protein